MRGNPERSPPARLLAAMFLNSLILSTLILGKFLVLAHKEDQRSLNNFQKRKLNYPVQQNKKSEKTAIVKLEKAAKKPAKASVKAAKKNKVATVKPAAVNPADVNLDAIVMPATVNPEPLLANAANKLKLDLLHKSGRYNRAYMAEYQKMISSLIPDHQTIDPLFSSRLMLPRPHEPKTVKSLYSSKPAKLPVCSRQEERLWKQLKVLQEEKLNSVVLKENVRTGARVVEKLMDIPKHYVKEMNFFSHAHHGSTKYFPSFICSARPKRRNERYSIITDFVDGDKSHVMASVATPEQLRHMVAQLFNSIIELHRVGFIHCDLSPANVMVTNDFTVQLIDFGMAMPVGQANGYRGSRYIRAPELQEMCPGKIDVAIDWWAFGVTVAIWYYYHFNPEALLLTENTYQFTPMRLKEKRFTHGDFPHQFSPELRKLLSLFLTVDPEFRTFSTVRLQNNIRNHEYFTGFDWSTADKS